MTSNKNRKRLSIQRSKVRLDEFHVRHVHIIFVLCIPFILSGSPQECIKIEPGAPYIIVAHALVIETLRLLLRVPLSVPH